MATNATSMQLSAIELKQLTGWPDAVIYEFLSMQNGIVESLLNQANTWTGKQTLSNYTSLGGMAIKLKKVTGTTGAAAGDTASVAHGVTLGKIISLTVLVNDGTTIFSACSPVVDDLFSVTADATDIIVTNGAAATTILSQPFVATVIYEE